MKKSVELRWSRIIPVAFVMYMLAYMDRINTGFVLPYMGEVFHFSNADIGFASGIFFVGYMVLQIPGAMLAAKWSSKKTVFILMILWSFSAMSLATVQTKSEFFIGRFILGVFEGGVWPAALVLLADWFPQRERGRSNGLWMLCLPLSSVVMAPITGWLLTVVSWRWVYFIEGLPALIWAVVWFFTISDNPEKAKWISEEEKNYILDNIKAENEQKPQNVGYLKAIANRTVFLLIVAYFFWMAGFYGFTLWVPSVVKAFNGINSVVVGLLSTIPFICAGVAMFINSTHSDKRQEREAHVAIPLIIAAFGLIGGQVFGHSPIMQMVFLCITGLGVYSPYGPFWAMPTKILRPEVVGMALGIINMLGNLGGFVGPYVVGYLKTNVSGSFGFIVLGIFLLICSMIILILKAMANEKKPASEKINV